MKVRLPKDYAYLPPSQKEAINQYFDEKLFEARNEDIIKEQRKWLKLGCVVLHDLMGKSVEDCMLYLANWHEVYRQNSKLPDHKAQTEYIDGKMANIFGDTKFVDNYLDKLEKL